MIIENGTVSQLKRCLLQEVKVWRCHICGAPWVEGETFLGAVIELNGRCVDICQSHMDAVASRQEVHARLTMPQPWAEAQRPLYDAESMEEMLCECRLTRQDVDETDDGKGGRHLMVEADTPASEFKVKRIADALSRRGVYSFSINADPWRNRTWIRVFLHFDQPMTKNILAIISSMEARKLNEQDYIFDQEVEISKIIHGY
jgi:hypothetical protein